MHDAMTRRGWALFAAMSVIWGMPYLFIKVAVEDLEPSVVVLGRTAIAAAILLAIAAHRRELRAVTPHWRPIVLFAAVEMAVPWMLLTDAERRLPSGLTGLLVACVPLVAAVVAFALGDRNALRPIRVAGIFVGLVGVTFLVGGDLGGSDGIPWWSVIEVLLVCVGYSIGPFIISRRLADAPSIGVVAVSLTIAALAVAPLAWFGRPDETPPGDALLAVLALALICTALAFVVFFALIAEVSPPRALLITFVNPAVAIVLGAIVLDEAITAATIGGFVLVISGCWLATRPVRTEGEVSITP